RQQAARALCRRRPRQDPGADLHHPLHPAAPPRPLRAPRPGGGSMITGRLLGNGLDWRTGLVVAILVAVAILVPVLNLHVPAESAWHVPTYVVSLVGKYLSFALLALSIDFVWGFVGILSLGHAAFFALGGYAMGMYLMRQIGSRGVYGNAELPDFMVFLNWKELPYAWYGFDHFAFAMLMVMLVPGLLAFVFGWFAF